MYIFRCHVVKTQMRTFVVIDIHDLTHSLPHLINVTVLLIIKPFHLEYAVYAFRHGVLFRISRFTHAYQNAVVLQQLYILFATVLAASVGMMYQSF